MTLKIIVGVIVFAVAGIIALVNSIPLVEPNYDESMLEGALICDSSLVLNRYAPLSKRVSLRGDTVNALDAVKKHAVLLVHGFGASTFEWREFFDELEGRGDGLEPSLVLLGAHGRDYETFKESTWMEWRTPIIEEYRALVALGYKKISIITASAGGTLVMSLIKDSLFKEGPAPETVIMIDPFLKAVDWRLPLVEYVGPILGNLYKRHSAERKPYWYSYIHYKPCVQLNNLAKEVTGALNKGLLLPEGTKVVCYTAQGDPIVDVESSVTIVSGLKSRNNEKIEHVWINSNRHVFTSLLGKDVSAKDASNQKKVFKEIVDYLNRNAPSL